MRTNTDKFNRWLVTSVALHCGLFIMVLISPSLLSLRGDTTWGTNTGGSGAISVRIESGGFSGIPLPAPAVVREDAAANDSPGLNTSEPAPKPQETVEPAPEVQIAARDARPAQPASVPRATNDETETPPPTNAVPYGEGGRAALQYGQFATGAGSAGALFGDAAFGDRYGAYVQAMNRAISQQWLRGMVNTSVRSAPRVYLDFTIARDGSVSDIRVQQSSGIPSLDRSAERAIRAAELPPLPSDYRGSNVTVRFYFEYVR